MEFITIKAKPGSKKLLSVGSTITSNRIDDNGKVVENRTKPFNGERFPGSKQFFRIPWSSGLKRWLLKDDEGKDIIDNKHVKLQELVKESRLLYPEKHPKAGQRIEEVDVYDPNDAFFCHKKCTIIAEEGDTVVPLNDPLKKIVLWGLRKHPKFQVSGENSSTSAGVRYIIVDKELDIKDRKSQRNKKIEVIELFKSLSVEKKFKIAMAMNLISNENVDPETVDDLLYNAAEDTSMIPEMKISRQDLFIQTCKMRPEDLTLKTKIAKAKNAGFLKRQSDRGWLLFGSSIGKTQTQIEEYLKNPEHSELLIRLEEALMQNE